MADNFYSSYPISTGVASLDGLTGALTLVAGTGIAITDNGINAITIASTSAGDVTLAPVGSAPNADGASISVSQVLTLQPADGTFPGLLTAIAQTIGGNKTFTGTISASNLSGTNTGDVTLGTANGLSLLAQVLSLGLSSTSTTGALSDTDWNTFNNKQAALTFGNLTDVGTDGITITGGTGAVIGAGTSISQQAASTTLNGYLSSTDFNTFNNKQSTVTIGALDAQAANADGLALVSNVLSTQSADATHPGMVNTTTQSFAGNKTFTGTISASNLSGTNSGDVTLTAVGATPNANGASLSTQALTLQPADGTNPGVLTAIAQTIGGAKTFSSTISASNLSGTNTGDVTLGTANGLSILGQVLSLGLSSTSTTGALSDTDWNTFNGKQAALTITNLTAAGTDGISITNGTGSVIGASPVTVQQQAASTTLNGYLTSTDWNTFNGKQAAGNYITDLTGDATASGPGSAALTLATVNGNVGSFGSATQVATFTVNAKGLITAASNTTIAIPFSAVSGTVPLNQGGTGQTTKAPAFDALSPMTTAGDIIIGGASGTGTRLGVGSAGQVLTVVTGAPAWATPSGASSTYNLQSANYTLVSGDAGGTVAFDVSGGSVNATLPTAVGISGTTYSIIRLADTTTNTVTILTTSAQTISNRASATITLLENCDYIKVVSDGANWQILDKKETAFQQAYDTISVSTVGNDNYGQVTNANITISVGTWRITGGFYLNIGSATGLSLLVQSGFYGANGANSASAPTALTGVISGTTDWSDMTDTIIGPYTQSNLRITGSDNTILVTVTANTTVYLVPRPDFSTAGTSVIHCWMRAERVF